MKCSIRKHGGKRLNKFLPVFFPQNSQMTRNSLRKSARSAGKITSVEIHLVIFQNHPEVGRYHFHLKDSQHPYVARFLRQLPIDQGPASDDADLASG